MILSELASYVVREETQSGQYERTVLIKNWYPDLNS